ncbi:unnamed protein product [Phytomonas sp. EM1]|nr:unnamed protein product [Phytomonas sp. EM1]|eukprot:CCW59558.1 unnamed protein product [Phytomonas sp. isolate EM1]
MPSPRKSTLGSRGSMTATRRGEAKQDAGPSLPEGKINGFDPSSKAAPLPDSINSSFLEEVKLVDAVLSGRSERKGVGKRGKNERGLFFWIAVIVIQVLLFLWFRWAMGMYTEIWPRLGKFFQ